MEKAFLNKENYLNEAGIYAFNFYSLGVPHTVVIDDYLPIRKLPNGHYKTLFAEIGDDNSLWGAMIEKAFAKYWGNYGHIVSGSSNTAMKTLIGAPFKTFNTDELSADRLWDLVHKHANNENMVTAGSRGKSDTSTNEHGLVENHAYTVLRTVKLSTGDRLVQLRNPWGRDSFNGDWSDKSGKWTDQLAKEANLKVDQQDGLIFMSIEDFNKMFDVLWINADSSYYHRTHFLRLNDDGKGATVDKKGQIQHFLTVKSNVDQRLWVQGNTWEKRASPDQCLGKWEDDWHGIRPEWGNTRYLFQYGSYTLAHYNIKAGESKYIRMDMNFGKHDAKDWSVVVFGDKQKLELTHNAGLKSDVMPVLADPQINIPAVLRQKPKAAPVPKAFPKERETEESRKLAKAVEEFPKDKLTRGQDGCKGGYHENLGQYNFIMMMEEGCEKKKNDFEFTVQVKEHEQKGISAWYNKQDHRGAYLSNSEKLLVKPCES